MKLNIGCGNTSIDGFTGIDILPFENVKIVHDLNRFPYPIKDNEVEEIWMDQVLEHLNEPMQVVEELFRICKNGALITIGVPYFRSFYAIIDPTHKNYFGVNWFSYFDPSHILCQRYQYSKAKFVIERIVFDREFESKGFFHRTLVYLANKYPTFYESKISHLLPLNSLTFNLKVLKTDAE
jgi:predicted SAM-dependent methyltransferase